MHSLQTGQAMTHLSIQDVPTFAAYDRVREQLVTLVGL